MDLSIEGDLEKLDPPIGDPPPPLDSPPMVLMLESTELEEEGVADPSMVRKTCESRSHVTCY